MSVIDTLYNDYKKIYVWGTGNYYQRYREYLPKVFDGFIDNSPLKQGLMMENKEVFSPDTLLGENAECVLIIICNSFFYEISEQIVSLGRFSCISIEDIKIIAKSCIVKHEISELNSIFILAGIHALYEVNGSRKFIDGQRNIISSKGYNVLDFSPMRYYKDGNVSTCMLIGSYAGENFFIIRMEDFKKSLKKCNTIIIHSLYYGEDVIECFKHSMNINVLYYIHDYSCLCENRFLIKNTVSCISDKKELLCDTCGLYSKQEIRRKLHESFFDLNNVRVIVPSLYTALMVQRVFKNVEVNVIGHQRYKSYTIQEHKNDKKIKVAFVGPAGEKIKGWKWFENLVLRLPDKYNYYCFGGGETGLKNIISVDVSFVEGKYMHDKLRKEKIDVACILSIVPETYCYTYFESLEAGCFIATTNMSGNVQDNVNVNRTGRVFSSCDEMIEWFSDENGVKTCLKSDRTIIYDVVDNDEFMKFIENAT